MVVFEPVATALPSEQKLSKRSRVAEESVKDGQLREMAG